jgi:hypothetical protein
LFRAGFIELFEVESVKGDFEEVYIVYTHPLGEDPKLAARREAEKLVVRCTVHGRA